VSRRTATEHSLLDTLLRDLGPALDEINASSLAGAEKKRAVRRLIEARLAAGNKTPGHENAAKSPQQSS
jgi:hypothetical protein